MTPEGPWRAYASLLPTYPNFPTVAQWPKLHRWPQSRWFPRPEIGPECNPQRWDSCPLRRVTPTRRLAIDPWMRAGPAISPASNPLSGPSSRPDLLARNCARLWPMSCRDPRTKHDDYQSQRTIPELCAARWQAYQGSSRATIPRTCPVRRRPGIRRPAEASQGDAPEPTAPIGSEFQSS